MANAAWLGPEKTLARRRASGVRSAPSAALPLSVSAPAREKSNHVLVIRREKNAQVQQRRAYSGGGHDTRLPPRLHSSIGPPPATHTHANATHAHASSSLRRSVVAANYWRLANRQTETSGAMSLHAARGGPHEDLSWSVMGRRPPRDVTFGDREGGGGMRRAQQGQQGAVRVDEASSASTFRELDEAFLQVRSRSFSVWLVGVLGGTGS